MQGHMSKAKKESVADVLARKKKETKKKPAKKKAGVNATKKTKKRTRTKPNTKKRGNKLNSDFSKLRKAEIYLDFIEFIASPTHLRKHESQKEFAQEKDINTGTLVEWKRGMVY
jgi:sRNA-binding protein